MDKLENTHRKLVHSTVEAMKRHQTMLEIAEERWNKKFEALENAFRCEVDAQAKHRALQSDSIAKQIQVLEQQWSVPRLVQELQQQQAASKDGQCLAKVDVLEEALVNLQTIQQVTSQEVLSLKLAFATQGVQASSQVIASAERSPSKAMSEMTAPPPDGEGPSNAPLVQALHSVMANNESLRVALSNLVEETSRPKAGTTPAAVQSGLEEVQSGLEEVREGQANLLKVSRALAEELNRIRELQNSDYTDTSARLNDIEGIFGSESKSEHRDSRVRAAAMDDSKFNSETFGIISQMQLKDICRTGSAAQDSPQMQPRAVADAAQAAPQIVSAIGAGTGDAGAGGTVGTGVGVSIGAGTGDVGPVIELLRAQLATGSEARSVASGTSIAKSAAGSTPLNAASGNRLSKVVAVATPLRPYPQ